MASVFEMLDDASLPSDEMARSLRDLEFVNRNWGGSHALEDPLLPRMRAAPGDRFVLLDVGAGSGDVARRLAARLKPYGPVGLSSFHADPRELDDAVGEAFDPRIQCVAVLRCRARTSR